MKVIELIKQSLHAHERGQQRLNLPPSSVDEIQKMVDKMWYSRGRKKLTESNYYSPLRDPSQNIIGYATFQKVGNPYRSRLVLTTILSSEMKPRGSNIGNFFNDSVPGIYPATYQAKPYTGMDPIPDQKVG